MADLTLELELGEAELDYNEEQGPDDDEESEEPAKDAEDGEIDDLEDGELKDDDDDEEEEDMGLERGEVPGPPPPMFTGGSPLKSPVFSPGRHSSAEKSRSNDMPQCKFYSKGLCTWGNECKFVHAGPVTPTRENYPSRPQTSPTINRLPPPPRLNLPPPPPLAPPPPPLPPGPIPPPMMMRPRLPPPPPRPPGMPMQVRQMLRPPPGFPPPPRHGQPPPRPFPPMHHIPLRPPPPLPCPPAPVQPREATPEEEESAWEKGLKRAKELMKKASEKKEMEREAEERAGLSMQQSMPPNPVKERGYRDEGPSMSPLRPPTPPEGFPDPPPRRDHSNPRYYNSRGRGPPPIEPHGAREVHAMNPDPDYHAREPYHSRRSPPPPHHHRLPPPPVRRNHDHPPPRIYRGTSQRHHHHPDPYPPPGPGPRYEHEMDPRDPGSDLARSSPGHHERMRRYSHRSGPEMEYSRSRSHNSEGEPLPQARHYRSRMPEPDFDDHYPPAGVAGPSPRDHDRRSSRDRREGSRGDKYIRHGQYRSRRSGERSPRRKRSGSGRRKDEQERISSGRELPYDRPSYGGEGRGEWKDPWERRKDRKTPQTSSSVSSRSSRSSRSTTSSRSSSRSPSSSPTSPQNGHRRRRYRGREMGRVASRAAEKALRSRKTVTETEENHPLIKKRRDSFSPGPSIPADSIVSPAYDPEDPVERSPVRLTLFNKTRMRPNVSGHEAISDEDEPSGVEVKGEEGVGVGSVEVGEGVGEEDAEMLGKETRREELLKQLKAVEDAIAKKRDPLVK